MKLIANWCRSAIIDVEEDDIILWLWKTSHLPNCLPNKFLLLETNNYNYSWTSLRSWYQPLTSTCTSIWLHIKENNSKFLIIGLTQGFFFFPFWRNEHEYIDNVVFDHVELWTQCIAMMLAQRTNQSEYIFQLTPNFDIQLYWPFQYSYTYFSLHHKK